MGDMNTDRATDSRQPVSALQLWADQARLAVEVMDKVAKEINPDV